MLYLLKLSFFTFSCLCALCYLYSLWIETYYCVWIPGTPITCTPTTTVKDTLTFTAPPDPRLLRAA
jgi:hypothetical protein